MGTLLKSAGVIVLLIGVGILAMYAFVDMRNNIVLVSGLGVTIMGLITHIFLNKKFE
jgi:membrane protein YdbS with pleckstrin-like domain